MWKWLTQTLTAGGLVLITLGCGCGSQSDSTAPEQASPPGAAETQSDDAQMATTLDQLTTALRKYSFEKKRLPDSFEEVIAAGYVRNPPSPPAGKQFGIDSRNVRVILVSQ